MAEERPVLGIDLGTSNTAVAWVDGEEVRVITDERGRGVTPSVVCLNRYGEFVVGHFAKAQMITNPHGTLYSAKRLLGCDFDSPDLQDAVKFLNFPVVDDGNNLPVCRILDRYVRPYEVSAEILKKIKSLSEGFLRRDVEDVVITVPAHFTDRQRKETMAAAELAGMNVVRLVNEPTAAALAYGYGFDQPVRVVVYDFGGGTFDISVLSIDNGVFEVLATGGDSFLGGDDLNNRISEHVVATFLQETGIDLRNDKMAMQRILDAVERAKIELSDAAETFINLPRVAPNVDFNAHLYQRLTQGDIDYLCSDLVDKTLEICGRVLKGARIDMASLDDVLLVGGQTRMPLVRRKVSEYFGRQANDTLNPDYVVAVGAAIQAHSLLAEDGGDVLLLDVTPASLGIESLGGLFTSVIPRNSKLPHRVSRVFTTASENQAEVKIKVFQGEERLTSDNTYLGECVLTGIRRAPRGVPQIDVTFRIDTSGVLHVSAIDLDTGDAQSIVIKDVMGFSTGGGGPESPLLKEAPDASRSMEPAGPARTADIAPQRSPLDAFGVKSGASAAEAFGVGPSGIFNVDPSRSTGAHKAMERGESSAPFAYDRSLGGGEGSVDRSMNPATSGTSSGPAPARLNLDPGTIIEGRYEILEQVGAGAFGAVYKARQLGIDRTVAIKLLLPEVTAVDSTAVQRFQQEAKLSASLEHPNTITIHDYGQTGDGMLFLVMEFVRGRTLQQVLRDEGALEPGRAIGIIQQVLSSLHEAHAMGVVHRDMKPGNIMLFDRVGARDVVKVLDFGIAKVMDKKKEAEKDLTMAGRIVGTPRYMAPEQVRGKGTYPASDIYSLGLIFYAMLTGKRAVKGNSTVELIAQQISAEPVIEGNDPRVPPTLMPVLLHATAKELAQRYTNAEEMLAELGSLDMRQVTAEYEVIQAARARRQAQRQGGGDPQGSGVLGRFFGKK